LIWGYPVGTDERLTAVHQLQIYPNPATAFATFNIEMLPAGHELKIMVYDITGLAANVPYTLLNKTVRIDTGNLPAGFYLVVVVSGFDQVRYRGMLIRS
jgi:hypothetical protein